MKKIMQAFLHLVIIILVLQVIKRIFGRMNDPFYSYTAVIIISSLQTLIVLGFILLPLFLRAVQKLVVRKAMARTIAVSLFIILIAACEWLCAWWLHHPRAIPGFLLNTYEYYYVQYTRNIIQFNSKSAEYSNSLFYTLKPSSRFTFNNAEFNTGYTTNSKGLRDDENSLVKPSVICLGDSYTMGWGVQQDSTYSSQLETMTGAKVLNTGISSYGTAREVLSLRQFDTTDLRYLLIQYSDNDVVENLEFIRNKYVLPVSSRNVYQKVVKEHEIDMIYYPGKHFLNLLQVFIKKKINAVMPVFKDPQPWAKYYEPEMQCKVFLDVLSRAPVNFAKTRVIVFRLDVASAMKKKFEHITDSLIHQPVYRELFHNNIHVLPLKDELNSNDFFILDEHLNSNGQRKVAEAAYRLMQSF